MLTLGLVAAALLLKVLGLGSNDDRHSQRVAIPAAVAKAGPGVVLYLRQVEVICQAHDAAIARHPGKLPLERIVRSESKVTSQIAGVPAPPNAREMRRTLLKARRSVDRIATKTYRLAAKSPDPQRTIERLRPTIRRRVDAMYGTFASLGAFCDISSAPSR